MRKKYVFIFTILAAAVPLAAQTPAAPAAPYRARFGFGPMGFRLHDRKVVTNAPYSADVNNSVTQTLSDGNSIVRTTSGHAARDHEGRTYLEETLPGGPLADRSGANVIFISDPVAGFSYVLNSKTKVAMRRPLKIQDTSARADEGGKRWQRSGGSAPVESDLGAQSINGLNAEGKSVTRTIEAGAVGNAKPIVQTTEVWTSPELQVVVFSKRNDPRVGSSVYSLNNIKRGDPPAGLFTVPSDYTIEDAPTRFERRNAGNSR